MKCPNCGAEATGRFCSYCGSELPKKEPNIHIEHNETIINNYENNQTQDYETIYEEEQMRDQAREEIARKKAYERQRQQSKNFLISFLIVVGVVLFVWYKVSSWWNGLFDDGITPISEDESEYENVINVDDNEEFFESFGKNEDNYKGKWYRITGELKEISYGNEDADVYVYHESEITFDLEMEDDVKIPDHLEGKTITFVGYLTHGYEDRFIHFSHCIIE